MRSDTRKLVVKVIGDSTSGERAVSRVGKSAHTTNSKLGKLVKTAKRLIGGFLAFKVIQKATDFVKDAVMKASDLNETINKTQVVLGSGATKVLEWSKNSAKAFGQSREQALDAASTFAVFGKSAGLSGIKLADFSTQMVGLASDMASFSNTSPEEAIQAIGAAMRGESEPIRKYGVLLNDSTLKNRAMKMGLIKTTKEALTPQQRVLAAQAEILRQTKDAQGDFARTSDGAANKSRILSAQIADTKAKLGSLLLPALRNVLGVLTTHVLPAVTNFVGGLTGASDATGGFAAAGRKVVAVAKSLASGLRKVAGVIGSVIGWFVKHKDITQLLAYTIGGAVVALKAYALYAKIVTTVTKLWAIAQAILNGTMAVNPIGLVVMAIGALVGALIYAYQHSKRFRIIVQAVWRGIKAVVGWVVSWFTGHALPNIRHVWNAIAVGARWLWKHAIGPYFRGIRAVIGAVVGWLLHSAWPSIRHVWNAIANGARWLWKHAIGPYFKGMRVIIGAAVVGWLLHHAWPTIRHVWNAIAAGARWLWKHAIGPYFKGIRAVISTVVRWLLRYVWPWIKRSFEGWRIIIRALWHAFRDRFKAIRHVVAVVINFFRDTIWPRLAKGFAKVQRLLSGLLDKFKRVFKSVRNTVSDVMSAVVRSFKKARDGIKRAWDKIRAYAAKPVNFVIKHVYRGGIKKLWDTAAKVLPIGSLPSGPKEIRYRVGGIVPGHGFGDKIHGLLEPGEGILTKDEMKQVGGPQGFAQLRAWIKGNVQRYEDGGPVGWGKSLWHKSQHAVSSIVHGLVGKGKDLVRGSVMVALKPLISLANRAINSLPHNTGIGKLAQAIPRKILDAVVARINEKDVPPMGGTLGTGGHSTAKIIALAKESGIPFHVTSTVRRTNDYHGQGKAVDFVSSRMSSLARYFYGFSGALLELLWGNKRGGDGLFVKNGKRVVATYYGRQAFLHSAAAGNEHVHVAMNGNAVVGGASGQLGSWIRRALSILHLPSTWIKPLKTLILRESGGNPRAINRWDSNAKRGDPSRGLMQTIGATFRRYRLKRLSSSIYDPIANIVAGLRYIIARYGSIFRVQQANSNLPPRGYAAGIRSAPAGPGWVGEDGPELLNFRGGESVTPARGNLRVDVHIHGPIYGERDFIRRILPTLRSEIEKATSRHGGRYLP